MTKASIGLQDLRRRIYVKAKAEPSWRFRVQYFHVYKMERTALMRKLKAVFRRYRSQPVERVINLINPMLRGWVNYFAVGHSSKCFDIIKDWVEKKVRRYPARAQKRAGFGWERWSWQWLYGTLRLSNGYGVQYGKPIVAPAG